MQQFFSISTSKLIAVYAVFTRFIDLFDEFLNPKASAECPWKGYIANGGGFGCQKTAKKVIFNHQISFFNHINTAYEAIKFDNMDPDVFGHKQPDSGFSPLKKADLLNRR
jgi:hypothetical protein